MSKENTKLEYPQFDIDELMTIVKYICDSTNFPAEHLLNLIVAQFIYSYNLGISRGMSPQEIIISFVKSSQNLSKNFNKLKESKKNG